MHLGLKQFEKRCCGECALGADVVSFMQINEMRKNVARGCGEEGGGDIGIDCGGEGVGCCGRPVQG